MPGPQEKRPGKKRRPFTGQRAPTFPRLSGRTPSIPPHPRAGGAEVSRDAGSREESRGGRYRPCVGSCHSLWDPLREGLQQPLQTLRTPAAFIPEDIVGPSELLCGEHRVFTPEETDGQHRHLRALQLVPSGSTGFRARRCQRLESVPALFSSSPAAGPEPPQRGGSLPLRRAQLLKYPDVAGCALASVPRACPELCRASVRQQRRPPQKLAVLIRPCLLSPAGAVACAHS